MIWVILIVVLVVIPVIVLIGFGIYSRVQRDRPQTEAPPPVRDGD